ncbi:MAG TPA: hypothetical protein IAA70_08630 [Candidatus Avoscillospira stercoripullorum]|uniref:Uncharacterized protein n=1 Tax=Candidatus Avoscillospira stercoripullorum TaxID=2840709 RepID=A0A9D1A8W2_9FIRM|nr:hypothetical protein [Candidatus Avoscillospira stercoripullorum]
MKFWKEHMPLRAALMLIFFLAGMGLVIFGWTMTGKMSGLIIMIVGLILLLTALLLYNKPFEDPKR